MGNNDPAMGKPNPHGRHEQTVTSPWKMWKHLIRRRRTSISGLGKLIEPQSAETPSSLRNKTFTLSEPKIVNILPYSSSKRNFSIQTEKNVLRKEYSNVYQKSSFGMAKLNMLNIQDRICSLNESTVQTEVETVSVSTQTLEMREGKIKDLINKASFQQCEHIPGLEECRLSNFLQTGQPCKDIKGTSTEQSNLACPPNTGYGNCQCGKISIVRFGKQIGRIECKETGVMTAALEEELNRITGLLKVHYDSDLSPNKRRRLDTQFAQSNASQPVLADEMLKNATNALIEELERIKMTGTRENKVSIPLLAKPETRPMLKSGLLKADHISILTDRQRKHLEELQSENVHIKNGLEQASEATVIKKINQSNQELKKAQCPNKPESGELLETDNFDWLRRVRQVAHDEALTPQQKDRALDRIVNAMIEQQNQRKCRGSKYS